MAKRRLNQTTQGANKTSDEDHNVKCMMFSSIKHMTVLPYFYSTYLVYFAQR